MKLQKRFNRKVGNKEYNKWIINLPGEKIAQIGWTEGTELDVDIKDGKLVLKPKKQ